LRHRFQKERGIRVYVNRNVLQTIKDTFDEMRAARAEREEAARAKASAGAESAAADGAEDDLDSVPVNITVLDIII
jgi:hypothetical protein